MLIFHVVIHRPWRQHRHHRPLLLPATASHGLFLLTWNVDSGSWFSPRRKMHWATHFTSSSCHPQPLQPHPSWCPFSWGPSWPLSSSSVALNLASENQTWTLYCMNRARVVLCFAARALFFPIFLPLPRRLCFTRQLSVCVFFVERSGDNDFVKRCITWEVEGIRQKKTWWACVKNDTESLRLSQKDAQFKNKWRRRIN